VRALLGPPERIEVDQKKARSFCAVSSCRRLSWLVSKSTSCPADSLIFTWDMITLLYWLWLYLSLSLSAPFLSHLSFSITFSNSTMLYMKQLTLTLFRDTTTWTLSFSISLPFSSFHTVSGLRTNHIADTEINLFHQNNTVCITPYDYGYKNEQLSYLQTKWSPLRFVCYELATRRSSPSNLLSIAFLSFHHHVSSERAIRHKEKVEKIRKWTCPEKCAPFEKGIGGQKYRNIKLLRAEFSNKSSSPTFITTRSLSTDNCSFLLVFSPFLYVEVILYHFSPSLHSFSTSPSLLVRFLAAPPGVPFGTFREGQSLGRSLQSLTISISTLFFFL